MTRLIPWLTAAVIATLLSVVALVLAQQLDRGQADDAPWRLASQVAAEIQSGASTTVDASAHIDLTRSLETWVVVEDAQGQATAGTGYLKNQLVSLPTGTLSAAAKDGRADATWEPIDGNRFTTVTLKVGIQFVSAGQSLAPSEARAGGLLAIVAVGWMASLLVLALAYFLVRLTQSTVPGGHLTQSTVPGTPKGSIRSGEPDAKVDSVS